MTSLTKLLKSNSVKAASATVRARLGTAASCRSSFHTSLSLVENKILLILPAGEATGEDKDGIYKWRDRCFYDLAEKGFVKARRVPKKLDEATPPKILGSSHGWLTCLRQSNDDVSLSLVKPSSVATDIIRDLPTLTFDPAARHEIFPALSSFLGGIRKIVTSDPRSEDCTAVMITENAKTMLAFCRIGDTEWRTEFGADALSDVVYNSMDKKVYAIDNSRRPEIQVWDLENPSSPKLEILKLPPIPEKLDPRRRTRSLDTRTDHYLVESSGDILLVRRHIGFHVAEDGTVLDSKEDPEDQLPHRTFWFDVLKLNKNRRKFHLVNCLDDQALFLGINHSFAVSASNFPGVERNSIYFADFFACYNDLGIFNLEHGIIGRCYPTQYKNFLYPPVWFAPTLDIV